MKVFLKLVSFTKNFLLFIPVTLIFYPLNKLMSFLVHFNMLTIWIYKNKKKFIYLQPFSFTRNYKNRYNLYKFISDNYLTESKPLLYLEFGVAGGDSFKWWINKNQSEDSHFWGFDTFEGLPENWGVFYKKGDMNYSKIQIKDNRVELVKGLFQDTLFSFIQNQKDHLNSSHRKVIHMDADLYSSTIFVLSQLYPYLKSGDIILFDEFNVPLHEFKAFKEFSESFYIKLEPLGAVNNFYQTAFIIS